MHPKKEESLNISTPINPPHWLAGSSTALKAQPGLMSVFYSQPSPLPPPSPSPNAASKTKTSEANDAQGGSKKSGKKWPGGKNGAVKEAKRKRSRNRCHLSPSTNSRSSTSNWRHLIPSRKCFINF